jgi:hypothetical protein
LKFWGVYKLMVGVLAAAESLLGMLHSANAPEMSIWGALTLAAAILLAIEGFGQQFGAKHRWIFVVLAAIVPIGISVFSDEWPPKLWMFAIALGFVEWMFQELKQTTGRTEIGTLVCCAALTISSGNTTLKVFQLYWDAPQFWPLQQILKFMVPIALPWTLILILLMHSVRELVARGPEPMDEPGLAAKAADD